MREPVLVSACLLGLCTRYDGAAKGDPRVAEQLAAAGWLPVPVCPEQLGGLPTPRPPARIEQGDGGAVLDGASRVLSHSGQDLTDHFLRGAHMTLDIALFGGCRKALLKQRSPSCSAGQIYRGETLVPGRGVTAELLHRHGLELLSEEDF